MQQQGLDLGSNQTALLAKIEELTLYVITLEQQLKKQQEMLDRIQTNLSKPTKGGF